MLCAEDVAQRGGRKKVSGVAEIRSLLIRRTIDRFQTGIKCVWLANYNKLQLQFAHFGEGQRESSHRHSTNCIYRVKNDGGPI